MFNRTSPEMRYSLRTVLLACCLAGVISLGVQRVLHYRYVARQIDIINKANGVNLDARKIYKDILRDPKPAAAELARVLHLPELISTYSEDNPYFSAGWYDVLWCGRIAYGNGESGRVAIIGLALDLSCELTTVVAFDSRDRVVAWRELDLGGGNFTSAAVASEGRDRVVVIEYCDVGSDQPRTYRYPLVTVK